MEEVNGYPILAFNKWSIYFIQKCVRSALSTKKTRMNKTDSSHIDAINFKGVKGKKHLPTSFSWNIT